MQTHNGITVGDAITDIGCYRLAARINDLRADGYKIRTETVKGTNRFGERTKYAKYFLETDEE